MQDFHFYKISPSDTHKEKSGPKKYIAVFKNKDSSDKGWGKSSPIEAKEIKEFNAEAGIPSKVAVFIFEVPSSNFNVVQGVINSYLESLRVKEKKENFDESNLNGLISHLNNLGHKLEPIALLDDRKNQATVSNNSQASKDREKELAAKLDEAKRALASTRKAEEKLQREKASLEDQLQREKQKNGTGAEALGKKTQELDTIKKELDRLKRVSANDQTTIDALQKKVAQLPELQKNIGDLQQQVITDTALIQALTLQEKTLEETLKTAQDKLKEKEDGVSRRNTDIGTLERKNSVLQAQLDSTTIHANQLQKKIDAVVAQKSAAVQQITAKEEEIKALKEGAAHSQTTLSNQAQQITQLSSQITDLQALIDTSESKLSSLESQSKELAALRIKLEETENTHQEALNNHYEALEKSKNDVIAHQTTIDALQKQVAQLPELQKNIGDLQQQVITDTALIQALTLQEKTLEETLKTAQDKLKEKEDKISRLSTESAALEGKNNDLQQQLNEQTTTAIGLQEKLATKQNINTALTQELQDKTDELTKALNQLNIANDTLQKQLHTGEKKIEQLEKQMVDLEKDLQLAQAQSLEKDTVISDLSAKIETQQQAHQVQLEQVQSNLQGQLDDAVSQKTDAEQKLETSQCDVTTHQATIEALQEEVKQIPELQKQLAALQQNAHFSQVPSSGIIRNNFKEGTTSMGPTTTNEQNEPATVLPSSNPPGSHETTPSLQRTDSEDSSSSAYLSEGPDGTAPAATPPTLSRTNSDSGRDSPTHSMLESSVTRLKEKCKQFIEEIVEEKMATIDIANAHRPLITNDLVSLDKKSILDGVFLTIDNTENLIPFGNTTLDKFVTENLSNDEDENTLKANLLSEFSADINNAIVAGLASLQVDKKNGIQEILNLITTEAVVEKLYVTAQGTFKKEFPESENATAIPTHISWALKKDLNDLLVTDNRLETLKDQFQKHLESSPLLKVDSIQETKKEIDTLLDFLPIQNQPTLRQSAENIAKNHAEDHKIRNRAQTIVAELLKEKIETTDAFKTRLDNLGLSSQAFVDKLMGEPANETLPANLEETILAQLKSAKEAGQVIDAQKITDIKAAIPDRLLAQINTAIETTLTTLEANQEKQGAIDNRLNRINPQAVLERLQKEAREVLDKQLSTAGGYQADETLLTRLNKSLLTLAQKHFETAKKHLGDNLASQTRASIQALNNDAVIDNLINTEFDQTTSNKTLKTKALAVTEKLAKELIDRYKDKKPDDLEKVYLDSLMSIDRSPIGFAQAKKTLTSRGLMLWIDKEARALTQIERDISSGRLTDEQIVLRDKINSDPNLDEKEKASYEKSIQLIEDIKAKHGDIKDTLSCLSATKKALQVHINVNDNNQDKALLNIAIPATRQHTVIATGDEQALIEARNKANTKLTIGSQLGTSTDEQTYKTESFVGKQTLLLAANIKNKPRGKGHVVTLKICKEDAQSKLYIDAIDNDDTYSSGSFFSRKKPIERYSNTAENVSFITQAMLETAQGTGNTPAEKGTGVLIINSHRPEWLNIYVELQVQKRLQPEQTFPFVQIEGPALNFLINDKKREQFKDKVEKLVEKRIKQRSVAESKIIDPLGIDSNNSRAALRGPG